MKDLYYNTVTSELLHVLKKLMLEKLFDPFRLVGGTALSLQRGHRQSVDIDLFTDNDYGTINFEEIDRFLKSTFKYFETSNNQIIGFGKSYFLGDIDTKLIKLDLYYTDKFFDDIVIKDGFKIATIEEILAMKIDVILRTGRKKDFWDIHELMDEYSLYTMLELHKKRYPYTHDKMKIIENFTNFESADNDFEPICQKGKYWEIIKLDFIDFAQTP